jgi:uncharacterized protein YbjT (DUF2867 family)
MILITGATGNVGRPLVGLFAGAGVPVRAFVRDPERARGVLGCGVELVEGDFAEPATLEEALGGVDRMFLLSGNPQHEGNAIDAAMRSGVERVVKQSALAAGLEPPPFHRGIEEKLELSGLGYTHLRPTAFMQTLAGYLPLLIDAEGVLCLPAGEGRIAWVDARDIAAVAFHALTGEGHEGRAYPITGPESLSMSEVAERLSAATGRRLRYENAPPEEAREIMVERGLPPQMADFLISFYNTVRRGETDFVTGIVPQVTGEPGRTFEDHAREQASAFEVAGSKNGTDGGSGSA